MLEAHARAGIRNRILQKIALEDWDLIGPHLEAVTLKRPGPSSGEIEKGSPGVAFGNTGSLFILSH
jgi:hypothetical protein